MKSNLEKIISSKNDETNKTLDRLEERIKKLLKDRRTLINCLFSVKQQLTKDVQIYRITRQIDSVLSKIENEK